ncbi:MAG: hypothetical protein ACOCP4_06335 [Candidatus Woesearchaeota archaeon]
MIKEKLREWLGIEEDKKQLKDFVKFNLEELIDSIDEVFDLEKKDKTIRYHMSIKSIKRILKEIENE